MLLEHFNTTSRDEAQAALRPCLDVARWIRAVVEARPFDRRDDLLAFAERAATPFSAEELEAALAHHPRIGERAEGSNPEATMARSEQSGVDSSEETTRALAAGNREYEAKFDRVFLIRAAGRSSDDILAALRERLGNSAERENIVVEEQLREIAVLRLEGVVSA